MALVKRGRKWWIVMWLDGKQIWSTTKTDNKLRAKEIEKQVSISLRTGETGFLDPESKAVVARIYRHRKWELPVSLKDVDTQPEETLTLQRSIALCLQSPEMAADEDMQERFAPMFAHLTRKLGVEFPVRELWIPHIRQYIAERTAERAAASTIKKELGALSRVFRNLIELKILTANPVRLIKPLSEAADQREVYLGWADFQRILDTMHQWYHPVILTAYYTGMRRGEIMGLSRGQVDLKARIISLWPDETKEGRRKRVPIHRDLVPVLESVLRVPSLRADRIFMGKCGQPMSGETIKCVWTRTLAKLADLSRLNFHDLRHTWKTNARRSDMDPEIREAILGHAGRSKTIVERYGRISNAELLKAIDGMTFDHGETVIEVGRSKDKKGPSEYVSKTLAERSKTAHV